jgi:hypothetical protein
MPDTKRHGLVIRQTDSRSSGQAKTNSPSEAAEAEVIRRKRFVNPAIPYCVLDFKRVAKLERSVSNLHGRLQKWVFCTTSLCQSAGRYPLPKWDLIRLVPGLATRNGTLNCIAGERQ